MTTRSQQAEAGFTLVEVLISMFIFSLISVGALIALTSTLNARDAAETRLAELEDLAATRQLMAEDFIMMVYRENRDGLGGFIDSSAMGSRENYFDLIRRGRLNPDGIFPRGDLLRVSWRVENGQLIRSFLPHENPAYVEPALDRVILNGVSGMDVRMVMPDTIGAAIASRGRETITRQAPLSFTNGIFAMSVTLSHADGTQTLHVFELPAFEIPGA